MVVVTHIEIWNDAENALLFLSFDLIFRHFDSRGDDTHLSYSGSKRHRDLRDGVILPRAEDSRGSLRREAHQRDCELEGSGSDVGKGVLPIIAR